MAALRREIVALTSWWVWRAVPHGAAGKKRCQARVAPEFGEGRQVGGEGHAVAGL
jgi:hypothetical protein